LKGEVACGPGKAISQTPFGCSNAIVATLCFFIMDRRICAGSRHLPALFFCPNTFFIPLKVFLNKKFCPQKSTMHANVVNIALLSRSVR
jgi:hypothetical protein